MVGLVVAASASAFFCFNSWVVDRSPSPAVTQSCCSASVAERRAAGFRARRCSRRSLEEECTECDWARVLTGVCADVVSVRSMRAYVQKGIAIGVMRQRGKVWAYVQNGIANGVKV